MSRIPMLLTAALILGFSAAELFAQTPRAVQRSAERAPAGRTIDPRNMPYPSVGQVQAPVLIVEFSEFGCPYCKRHAGAVLPQVLEKYVERGEVRYLFVQAPPEGEQSSEMGAIALLCAAHLDALLPMYQQLFRAEPLTGAATEAAAATAGIDPEKFKACVNGPDVRRELQQHIDFAKRSGVIGTPTFLIGRAKEDRLVDIKTTFGIQSLAFFEASVDRLLKARR